MALESIPFSPSGNIESIWYDADIQSLLVRYHHQHRVYRYSGVSGELAAGFSQSLSANDYLKNFIMPQSIGEFIGIAPADDAESLAKLLA